MSIVLQGSTSGSVTLQEPAVAGTTVLDLPATSGTILTTNNFQSGGVVQVVSANNTLNVTSLTSTSFITLGLTASITPKFSSSKIYVMATFSGTQDNSDNVQSYITIFRNSTDLRTSGTCLAMYDTPGGNVGFSFPISFYDSPSSTSALTYTVYAKVGNSASQFRPIAGTDTIVLMEIAA